MSQSKKDAEYPNELEVRLRQQALLAEIGRRALVDLNFDRVLAEAVQLVALGLDVRYCKVLEYLPEQNRLLVRAGVGWHEGVVGHATVDAELHSPAGYALHTGKPVISNHLSSEDRFSTPELLIEHNVQRAINVILLGDGRPYGVLEADSEVAGSFSEHDVDFMQGVANLLGLSLERSRADQALRDLNNRLEQQIEAEVAERRLAEDALHQAQKMEAVGQLTGGVAHDFNNLLLVIMGNLDLIARATAGDERLAQLVATAHKGAVRGAQLTSQLLSFARRQTLRPETRRINELVQEFDILTTRLLGEAISVDLVLDPQAGSCEVDPAQFGSALLNLVVNARDAMPDGGRLTIRSANMVLDARGASKLSDAHPGAYVVVEVADTGTGMSPDVLARATEPFFTTKAPGQGTGLGLSQVYGFVRQSGGFLTIESRLEIGTTIRIHLPAASGAAPELEEQAEAHEGAGTVLVVEDDEDVRFLVVAQLEDLGYRVVAVSNGPEALEVLSGTKAPTFDLLLTDFGMPGGMNGVELVRAARQRQPGLKALLTSGYAAGLDPRSEGEHMPFLPKPYQQADLARAIADALASARTA